MFKSIKITQILILCAVLFLVLSVSFFEITRAQGTSDFVILSDTQVSLVGIEGGAVLSRSVNVIGIADGPVTVTVFPTELYDKDSGASISGSAINISQSSFTLTRNGEEIINISLNIAGATAGNYVGTIIVTAENGTTIEHTNINVTVTIKTIISSILPWIFLSGIVVSTAIAFLLGERRHSSKFVVVAVGMVAVSLWLASIKLSSFFDPNNIISTILIGNLVGYIVYYVKDVRESNKDLEKTTREIRNKGLETDIELIRNLFGEITAHHTSFVSDYSESGLLSRKVWDASAKEGIISDLPTRKLEEYYSFVNIYNRYYAHAVELLNKKKMKDITEAEFDFKKFDVFRTAYSELENVIFINLQYDIGLVSYTRLSPLESGYPRVSRMLLYALIDCGALKPPIKDTRESYKAKIKNREIKDSEFVRIVKEIYTTENTELFLGLIECRFNEKYEKVRKALEPMDPPVTEKPDLSKEEADVKGTFTLNLGAKKLEKLTSKSGE